MHSDEYAFTPATPSIFLEIPSAGDRVQSQHAATLRDGGRPCLAGWPRKNYAGARPVSRHFRIWRAHRLFGTYRAPRPHADPYGTRRRPENRQGAALHAPRLAIRDRHRVLPCRYTASPSGNVAPWPRSLATTFATTLRAKKNRAPFSGSAACECFSSY